MNHIIRLGTHAEKDYLNKAAPWYDEVLLNANLVEATAGASSYFLSQLDKDYFIEPVTFAFALDPLYIQSRDKEGQLRFKRTFTRLAVLYGLTDGESEPIPQLTPEDFADDVRLRHFCERVLDYQRNRCEEALRDNVDFLDEPATVRPVRLLAPYFYPADDADWQAVNGHLIERSAELAGDIPLWGVICMDARILDQPDELSRVADFYSRLPCSGICLWLTNLHEPSATAMQLTGLRRLVSRLSAGHDTQVMNLYGGYFSAVLQFDGLSGFSHGVGYGERRDIVPVVGGGLPPAKYYLPPIHEQIYVEDLVRLAGDLDTKRFVEEICDCVICRGLLEHGVNALLEEYSRTVRKPFLRGYRDFPEPIVYRYARYHFLHNRHKELETLATQDRERAIAQLDDARERFRSQLGLNQVRYLHSWATALRSPLE